MKEIKKAESSHAEKDQPLLDTAPVESEAAGPGALEIEGRKVISVMSFTVKTRRLPL